jgi:hypothetical protein
MKNNKIPCSNISTETYTGKEQSPKRFGLSAEGFEINYEKEGYDKQIWSVQLKNNRKVWVRNCNRVNITHEEPIITNYNMPQLIEEQPNEEKEKSEEHIIDNPTKPEKKKTDYNIFIKYYLDKLKAENKDNKITNKTLFSAATEEWARLKKNPEELKKLMLDIKK